MKSPTEQEVMCSRYDWMEHDIRVLANEADYLAKQLTFAKEQVEKIDDRLKEAVLMIRGLSDKLDSLSPYEENK